MKRRVALSLAVVASAACCPRRAARAEPRAVIELFTSQGCSSCPPADKLAGELAQDPSLLVMSLPVDYWDYLGWKDTLANPGHTKRQRAYSKTRGDREVYTPQVVVNGMAHVLGSDRSAIENAIKHTGKQAGTLSLPVARVGRQRSDLGQRAGRQGQGHEGRNLALSDHQERAGHGRQRREFRTHHHVSQRGAANGSSSASGPARRAASRCRCATSVTTRPSRSP